MMKQLVLICLAVLLIPLGCTDPTQIKLNDADKLYSSGNYGDAIAIYKEVYATKPTADVKSKLATAWEKWAGSYFASENYTDAISAYNEALVYDPTLDLKKQLGDAYYKRGVTSLKRDEQYPIVLAIVGRNIKYYSDLRDCIPMAVSDLTHAIDLNPSLMDALNDRGYAYMVIGEYDKAIPDLNKVIEMDAANKLAYYGRGLAFTGKGQYDVAIRDLSKAIELDNGYAKAYFGRAYIYYNFLQQYYNAVNDYSSGLELISEKDPFYTTYLNNRAVVYLNKLDQPAKAADDFSKIIALQPKNALAYYNRGWCYHNTRRYQESLNDFQKYLDLDINDTYKVRLLTSGHIDGLNRILSGAVTQ